MRRRWPLPAVLLTALAACGTNPGSTRGSDAGADTSDTTGDTSVDAALDTGNECSEAPPFDCVPGCGGDVFFGAVCEGGVWFCEEGIPTTDCPDDTCFGFPPPNCCDPSTGENASPPVCVDGAYVCRDDEVPGPCDPGCGDPPPLMCVFGCGGDAFVGPECVGGAWGCPEGTMSMDECPDDTCWGRPAGCCDPSTGMVVTGPDCLGGDWICPEGTAFDACGVSMFPSDITGTWHEVSWVLCDGQVVDSGPNPVAELIFSSDGTYTLTYASGLFETYRDYWGAYAYDPTSGGFRADIDSGNYIPADADLEGTVYVDDAGLRFDGVWFGTPPGETLVEPAPCGQILQQNR